MVQVPQESPHEKLMRFAGEAYNDLQNRADCSKFVHAVAKPLLIPMKKTNDANRIFAEIQSPPWVKIGYGATGAQLAVERALAGYFVVGALFVSGANGHVVVVTGPEYILRGNGKAASLVNVAQGRKEQPQKALLHQTIRLAFRDDDLKRVYFACQPIPA